MSRIRLHPRLHPRLLALVVALAAAGGAQAAQAQAPATGTATASATVIAPLGLTVTNALTFGRVLRGGSKSLGTNGNGADANSRFYVSGQGAHDVAVTITLPSHLTKGADQLLINNWLGTADTFDWNNMAPFAPVSGQPVTRTLPGTTAQADQRYYFRLAARVVATGLQPLGLYTGTITITAAYAGI